MFQKPAFGSNTSGFGSFNAGASTSSPFGGFKSTTGTSAFGAPSAFGASTSTQSTAGGGLFGASTSTGGLFGSTPAPTSTPAFGTPTSGFGFGGTTSSGGLFSSNNTSTGLFGNTGNTSAFGAKPPGFGFGSASTSGTTGGLFGSTPTTGAGLFGQQNTTLGGGGLFSNTSGGFGQQQTANGTAHVKYSPVVGTDVVVKSGTSQNINTKHHCITCMKEYENKSLEELRLDDYTAGRKGSAGGMFGGFQQQPETKPLFGGSTFGQPATTSAPSMFGGGLTSTSGFGQSSTFSFGNTPQNQTNTTGLFGGNKPAFGTTTTGTGLFGATTTQAPSFGTPTSTFGFGATNPQNQTVGLFGAKPATTGFGTTPSTGFGSFGTSGSLFGAKPQQTAAPAFGTTTPAFGLGTSGFGTNTSTSGGLFGANNTFGKMATTQPSMGFGNPQPTLGLGTGLGTNTFQVKSVGTPGFGTLGTGLFGQQPGQTNTFKTGLEGGLGGGIFGNTSTIGSTPLGGFNANTTGLTNPGVGGTSGGNVHEQILTLAARPYGDSPLFKDLLPDTSTTAEDVLRPTNPAAVKAVLDSSNSNSYRVTSPSTPRLKLVPRAPALPTDKKSLFDGLEESDSTLEDKLSLKPSRKRLVLRANNKANDSMDYHNNTNRSLEDLTHRNMNTSQTEEANKMASRDTRSTDMDDSRKRLHDYTDNNNISPDRHGSWLSSPKAIERVIEKPIDETTPRLYPDLNKELPVSMSERRASWLTTKPLRKPLVSKPESIDNTMRELGVRSEHTQNDKENIDSLSVTEEEQVSPREMPPHPTGVKLTRPGYYTVPSLDEMISYMRADGSCIVPHLTIGRQNYGNVHYDCEQIDVTGLDLDALVYFRNKEVIIYPEDSDKPPIGEGLNRRAVVTLDRVWPRDKTEKRPITDPQRLMLMDYEGKLRRVCDKHDTKFIEYRPQTGSWVFRVEHFSRYGISDSDEEDDVPDVLKRQLVNQSLQKAAPIAATAPKSPVPTVSGLGGLGELVPVDNLYTIHQAPIHQTSLNLLNGTSKVFEMDTTENNTEVQSLYHDTSRAFGVKSPTSELAKLEQRQTHNVQLMKASLYADTEMEDDVSVSTGDQLVPQPTCLLPLSTATATVQTADEEVSEEIQQIVSEEVPMQPLIVRPLTVVLNYHRKVPPFKRTIAGRLDAACIADMSVCRARHSRIGFGPAGALVYATTYISVNDLPKSAELCELSKYVRGRHENDWSEPLVAMLALGQSDNTNIRQILSSHLSELLEFSSPDDNPESTPKVPRLRVRDSPQDRLQLLRKYAKVSAGATNQKRFGVSGVYWHQIWKLCEALWGADLENDGVPGTDEESIVNRHKKLLEWLKDAVSDVTDLDLAIPIQGESEDKADGHSLRVWTLLLGGRVMEACKLSREVGDLNMAALLAQADGDPIFRSLIARQLSQWNECGASEYISSYRLATLQLIAGGEPPTQLSEGGWMRGLLAAARYICPQIPSLEQVIRKYESFFSKDIPSEEMDLTVIDGDGTAVALPLPSYVGEYECNVNNGIRRRVLDLRYELLRARAFNRRPKLQPASYTPDPLDYTLCFLLGTWFDNPTVESITGIADQLEATGDWHLAIQALAYHPNDMARNHLIRGVLSRHAPSQATTPELQSRLELVRRLSIPEKWLRVAQANRAKYEKLPAVEAEHLTAAGEWNAAHEVLLEHLMAQAVLTNNLESISSLLEQLNSAAERHEVSGWENGGQAVYHYMHVCQEIQSVVCDAEAGDSRARVQARLEALRPRVAAACRSLAGLEAKNPRIMAARAEMGARLVQFPLAAGAPPHQLAAMLKALRLPPDAAATATHKITSDLAEQASELCIESVPSSPPSSRHRALEDS